MSRGQIASLVARKELREAMRDRRTVVLTFLLPLVFYPLLVGVFGFFAGQSLLENEMRSLRVSVAPSSVGADLVNVLNEQVQEGEQIQFHLHDESPSDESTNDISLHLEPFSQNGGWLVESRYESTAEGEVAKRRVGDVLERWSRVEEERALEQLGLSNDAVNPVRIAWKDTASVVAAHGREAAGMLIYFLLFLSFTACLSIAVDVGAGEKERGTMETLLTTPASRGSIFAGKLIAVVAIGCASTCCSIVGFGLIALLGSGSESEVSQLADDMLHLQTFLLAAPILFLTVCLLAAVTLALSLRAASAKQAQAQLAPLLMIVVLALVTVTTPGVALNESTVWIPVLNAALAVRSLLVGSVDAWWQISVAAGMTLVLILLMIRLGSRALKSQRALGS